MAMAVAGLSALVAGMPVADATFPGPNGRIAFTSRYNSKPQIWTMTEKGMVRRRLTGPARPNFHPGYSVDGKRIVFISTTTNGGQPIFAMNADGNLRTRITTGTRRYGDPAMSPDGKWIIAAGWRGSNPKNLWLVKADGTGAKRFTKNPGNDLLPSFSPDGTKVIWTRFRPNGTSDVFVRNLDGTGNKQLTHGTGNDKGGSFSPDGAKVVYTHVVGPKKTGRLWIMNADGTGRTKRTNNPLGTMYDHAVFSPDGLRIAFIRERDTVHLVPEIFVIHTTPGGGMDNITQSRFDPIDLDWGVG